MNTLASLIKVTLEDIPPQNVINYDETNLSDDQERNKVVVKRGTKYPERIIKSLKSSTSLILASTAVDKLLPVYVVYKSEELWDT